MEIGGSGIYRRFISQQLAQAPCLRVFEFFRSLQGESTYAGLPCAFVRLAGCSIGCRWCDTPRAQSFSSGTVMSIAAILRNVQAFNTKLVEITGGEPLQQSGTPLLASTLVNQGYTVLVETSGLEDISVLDWPVRRIVDVKGPSSGVVNQMRWHNLDILRVDDEVKFCIADRSDFDFAIAILRQHNLEGRCQLLFSPVSEFLAARTLADWLLDSHINARLQLQLHKILWPGKDGV